MYVTFHGFNVIILYTEFFMLANVTGTELGLPRPRTTYLDFTLTKTFDHHKMATSHDGKSLLLNHGGKMKSVKRVNNQRFVSVLLSVLLIRSPDNLAIQKYTIINVSSISVCFELSYIYIYVAGWFCPSEKKRFRQADHRSYAAEGVPAQSSEQGSHWSTSQSSNCPDKYLHYYHNCYFKQSRLRDSWHVCLSISQITQNVMNLAL